MLMTDEKRKRGTYLQDVINEIQKYNPENSFVGFRKYLENSSNLMVVLNNKLVKADAINELIEAARKRISFLIEDDDKILELYKENKELLDDSETDKMDTVILQMHSLVNIAEVFGVEKCCKRFVEEGSSIFESQNVLEYLQVPKNRVNWINVEHEKDARIKYINKLCALMIVEHIHGDSDELKEIATNFPESIKSALFYKLRNTEKAKKQNPESAR